MIDQQAIEEFKALYLQGYGIQLTDQQAVEYGTRLIRFVKAVYGNKLPRLGFDKRAKKRNNKIELKSPLRFFDGRLGQP